MQLLKEALKILLNNDASDFRPSGSMTSSLYWWNHGTKIGVIPSAKVFRSLRITPIDEYPYYSVDPEEIPGVSFERYECF